VQIHFIQRKQFNETNVTSHPFQQISNFNFFSECFCGPLKTLWRATCSPINRLCSNLEFSRHFPPITFLEKLAESHDIHISITPSKCSKRSVHDTSPANGKYEHDQTLPFSKPFGTISSWFSFVVETGSSKRRSDGSAGTVNTTEMLLDAIKDLWEEGTLNYLAKISTIFVII